jgi:hypothetical protein
MGVAEADEARTFGIFGEARLEADGAHFIRGAAGRARHGTCPFGLKVKAEP